MNTIFIILGTLGSVFAVVMTALAMINYRKPKKITGLSTFLSGLISLLSLAALTILGGMRLNLELGLPLFMVGLFLGYLRGTAVKLNWENGQVIGRNSIIFLILWGLSLALSQLLGLLGSPLLASLGYIPVVFTTALQAGFYGNLFLRRLIMGRKAKTRKGLQVVIGIAGGIGLFLLMVISFLILGSEAMDAFLLIGDRPAAALSYQEDAAGVGLQSATSEPATDLTLGQLPDSGKLVINCGEEYERQKEYSLSAYNFIQYNFSFDEAFTSYEIEIDMEVDLSDRTFTLDHEQHEGWNVYLLYPDSYTDKFATLIYDVFYRGEGKLHDDGWISGSFDYYLGERDRPDDPISEGSNDFYGYLDDQVEHVVICVLNPYEDRRDGKPNEFSADFAALRAAGKDQLIPSWYNFTACSTCSVDGITR